MTLDTRPDASEFNPYYSRYISLVPGGSILATLREGSSRTTNLFSSITEEQASFRYAPDKWTIKQMFGHIIDTERIFAYRALRISRNDTTPIEGFEQDDYVSNGPFDRCALADLLDEYSAVRNATVLLFSNLTAEGWSRKGVANKNEITVRALAYIVAGHELHHCHVLREKYLPSLHETGKSVGKS